MLGKGIRGKKGESIEDGEENKEEKVNTNKST